MGPGQESGQLGLSWGDYVDALVSERGSLAALAQHLAERRGFREDLSSVERGLRRLRGRGSKDGGVWGQRALRCFGLPSAIGGRVRWMGQYHTRFTDLPLSLCEELVRPWDRPPISESPARIWIFLAHVSIALRARADPDPPLAQAGLLVKHAELAAQIELALVESYCWGRRDRPRSEAALARAGELLGSEAAEQLSPDDRACLHARWIDQRAYPLNKPRDGRPPEHAAALALYEQISPQGPPFARCRRANGLGWSWLQLGEHGAAAAHARASMAAAGDSGSLRMRAMALNLLAAARAAAGSQEQAEAARRRARDIAQRLEDEALLLRFSTARTAPGAAPRT